MPAGAEVGQKVSSVAVGGSWWLQARGQQQRWRQRWRRWQRLVSRCGCGCMALACGSSGCDSNASCGSPAGCALNCAKQCKQRCRQQGCRHQQCIGAPRQLQPQQQERQLQPSSSSSCSCSILTLFASACNLLVFLVWTSHPPRACNRWWLDRGDHLCYVIAATSQGSPHLVQPAGGIRLHLLFAIAERGAGGGNFQEDFTGVITNVM